MNIELHTFISPSPEWRVTYVPVEGPEKGRPVRITFDTEARALTFLAEIRRLLTKAGEFNEDERFILYQEVDR